MTNRLDTATADDLNAIALVKGEERYVILYDDASRQEALRQVGRWAAKDGLSFTWYDAAALSQRIRAEAERTSKLEMEGD